MAISNVHFVIFLSCFGLMYETEGLLWRSDWMCGPKYLNTESPPTISQCNPTSWYPCCDGIGIEGECWGNYAWNCDCAECQDYSSTKIDETWCERSKRLNEKYPNGYYKNSLLDGREPDCDDDGQFEPKYCNSTHCVCVDVYGFMNDTTATDVNQDISCPSDFTSCTPLKGYSFAWCIKFGFKLDSEGCPTDTCVDPCEDVSCGEYLKCDADPYNNCSTPCSTPNPTCVFEKENFCKTADGYVQPLMIDSETVRTCDAYSLTGCPAGYKCQMIAMQPNDARVGFCCPVFDCKSYYYGFTYRGTRAKTSEGYTCQAWNTFTPQRHSYTSDDDFFGGVDVSSNYCRNPGWEYTLPWCYSTYLPEGETNRKKTCDVPACNYNWHDFIGVIKHSSGLCLNIENLWPTFITKCHKKSQIAVLTGLGRIMFLKDKLCLKKGSYYLNKGDYLGVFSSYCESYYNYHYYKPSGSFEESGSVCWSLGEFTDIETGLVVKDKRDLVITDECHTIRQKMAFISITQDDCPEGLEKQLCDESICDDAKCSFHGESACFIDPCGQCSAVFLDFDNKQSNCSHPPSKCERDFVRAERKKRLMEEEDADLAFTPQCLEDGNYNVTQCHPNGLCWCVFQAGNPRNSSIVAPPLCDFWASVSVSFVVRLDQPYLYIKNTKSTFLAVIKSFMVLKFDLSDESIRGLQINEDMDLEFTLQPVGRHHPPPYDISSLGYRIECALEDKDFEIEFGDHFFKGSIIEVVYNPYVVPPPEDPGDNLVTIIVAVLIPLVVLIVLGVLIVKATKKNKSVKRHDRFTKLADDKSGKMGYDPALNQPSYGGYDEYGGYDYANPAYDYYNDGSNPDGAWNGQAGFNQDDSHLYPPVDYQQQQQQYYDGYGY